MENPINLLVRAFLMSLAILNRVVLTIPKYFVSRIVSGLGLEARN